METTKRSITEYLSSLPEGVRDDIKELHRLISKHMPGVKPKMWEGVFWGGSQQSIIGYGDLNFTRSDKKEVKWFAVGLSLQKNYISIYVVATVNGHYALKESGKKLGKVKLGSSSISFKKLEDLDLKEFVKLVDLAYAQLSQK